MEEPFNIDNFCKQNLMEGLLKEREESIKIELLDKHIEKLNIKTNLKAGDKIVVTWVDREDVDTGYLFALPQLSHPDEYDLFYHIPFPDSSDGIGQAPEVFGHLTSLLTNDRIRQINVNPFKW